MAGKCERRNDHIPNESSGDKGGTVVSNDWFDVLRDLHRGRNSQGALTSLLIAVAEGSSIRSLATAQQAQAHWANTGREALQSARSERPLGQWEEQTCDCYGQ